MTPNARIAAAIDVLDQVLAGAAAEQALLRWSRGARFAGSKDRAAVRDLVFDSLRRRRSRALRGGAETGRGLMLGLLHEAGTDPAAVFTGRGHDPAPLDADEGSGRMPAGDAALDLPAWLLPAWRASLGPLAEPVAMAMRDRAPVWLRVNPRKASVQAAQQALSAEGIETRPADALPTALQVVGPSRQIAGSRAYRQGLVELQDLSAQLACAMLPLRDGMRVLDLCAGGGGKALALAGRADISVTAHDADPGRMRDLPARAARAGVDVAIAADVRGAFDLVLADVPCSGSGTWRRTPDQKWRLTQETLTALTDLQARILRRAADHVGPGGHLAYMTCSLLEAENAAQITAFLHDRPDFRLQGQRRMTPLDAGDGFYVALMDRRP